MTILVIGGAGYIGSVACEKFINEGNKVIILDDLSTGFKELIHKKAIFIKGSMLNYSLLQKIFQQHKIDVVALYAAKIIIPESEKQPIDYYLTNITGLALVLKVMLKNKVKNIIFTSSAAVYGKNHYQPIKENDSKIPCNPYGKTKLFCENLLIDSKKAYKINFIILRFFNVAGASKSGKFGMLKTPAKLLIPVLNDCFLKNKTFFLYGQKYKTNDGTCMRDYIHVEDLATIAWKSLKMLKQNKSAIYNIGMNQGYTNLQIVKLMQKYHKQKLQWKFTGNRLGDPDFLIANNKKIMTELNWKPRLTLKQMILSDYLYRKKHVK